MRFMRRALSKLFLMTGVVAIMFIATGCGSVETSTTNADYHGTKTNILDDRAVGR